MDKKGIVIACGLVAVVAVAGGTLKSVLAADEPEVGSAVHTGIAGGYIRDEGITKGESLAMLVRVYEGIAKEKGYLTDVSRGESIGEVIGNEGGAVEVEAEVKTDAGELLASLNDLIDPDLHVDFSDLGNLVIDDEMTQALKQTRVYMRYELEGMSDWYDADECIGCFDENLNTLLLAYNAGDISKEDYYRWCNECLWPTIESLRWKNAFQNLQDRVETAHGSYTETSAINPTVPGNEHLASNPSSGNTGNGGGSGAVNQGSGAGGGTSVVQTPEQPPADPGASNGGYNTPDWQDPAATESWAGQPATEESIKDFFSDIGGSKTDAEAADSVNRQATGNEGAVIR